MSWSEKKQKKKNPPEGAEATNEPSYLNGVVNKLKKYYDDETMTTEELKQKAKWLTDPKELHYTFSHLTDVAFDGFVSEIADEDYDELCHSMEVMKAEDRAKKRACPPPVKLHLFELKNPIPAFVSAFCRLFLLKYGVLHAEIQIGDVILQWDNSSLVIPSQNNPRDPRNPIFQTNFGNETTAAAKARAVTPQVVDTVMQMEKSKQVDLLFDMTMGVADMIEKVKEVIVKYNRHYYYHPLLRNCQMFVDDIMKAIGVPDVETKLTGRLKNYFKQLKANKTRAVPSDFPTHEQLDDYVKGSDLSDLTQHDKEYLLCLYMQFHLQAMKTNDMTYEQCQVKDCHMAEVERQLEEMTLETFI